MSSDQVSRTGHGQYGCQRPGGSPWYGLSRLASPPVVLRCGRIRRHGRRLCDGQGRETGSPSPQRGAHVDQDVTLQRQRGIRSVRGDRFRQRAREHAHGRQAEAGRIGWHQEFPGVSCRQRGEGAIRQHGNLRRSRHILCDGLSGLQVRERGLQRAGAQESHGPVRGLEYLAELRVDHGRHLDLEPAEQRRQGEGLRWLKLPLRAPGKGGGGYHHPAEHAQQHAERHNYSQPPHGDHLRFARTHSQSGSTLRIAELVWSATQTEPNPVAMLPGLPGSFSWPTVVLVAVSARFSRSLVSAPNQNPPEPKALADDGPPAVRCVTRLSVAGSMSDTPGAQTGGGIPPDTHTCCESAATSPQAPRTGIVAETASVAVSIRTSADRFGTSVQTDPGTAAMRLGPPRNVAAPTGMTSITVSVAGSILATDPVGLPW